MAYRHNDALYKHKVRAHRLRKIAIGAVSISVIAVGFVGIDWLLNQLSNSNTVVSRENTTSVQSVNVGVYRTEFFQFQAPDEWVAVAGESTDKRFVYVKNNGSLITQKIVIYVDRPKTQREADFKVTNVLPVEISNLGNIINIGEVSDHCNESWTDDLNRDPARITHQSVSFVCSPDSKQFNVVLGTYNGDEELPFTMSDGRLIHVTFVYSDLTAYPGTGDIYNIVSSFSVL